MELLANQEEQDLLGHWVLLVQWVNLDFRANRDFLGLLDLGVQLDLVGK